jgi:hypothetical protein
LINNADVINVLYNFNHYSGVVFQNIKAAIAAGKVINIRSIDTFVNVGFLDKISNLNRLKIKAWKIVPYQQTLNDSAFPKYTEQMYENTIMEYIKLSDYMQFSFQNKLELEGIIKTDNFPMNTVYITPNNKFGLGKIDERNNFFIEEYETVDELEKNLKSYQSQQILLCKGCKYQSNCLANRYFNPNIITKSLCSGHKDLIKLAKGK